MAGNSEATFDRIKRLLRNDPLVPFRFRCGNQDIEVSHPNAMAFHPEVPFVTIYDKTEFYEVPIDKIAYVQHQHAH